MKISHLVETENGTVEVQANLTEDEVKFIMKVGLNVLYAHGSIPFLAEEIDVAKIQPTTTTAQ